MADAVAEVAVGAVAPDPASRRAQQGGGCQLRGAERRGVSEKYGAAREARTPDPLITKRRVSLSFQGDRPAVYVKPGACDQRLSRSLSNLEGRASGRLAKGAKRA